MERLLKRLEKDNLICMLWVSLCFALTSAIYLSWLDRLVRMGSSPAADWISMVAGYLMQAAGTGIVMFLLKRGRTDVLQTAFLSSVLLLSAVMIPALITDSLLFVICSGLLINCLCGIIAGFYLYVISLRADERRRGIVFGFAYAAATLAVGLLAFIGMGSLLHGRLAIPLYLAISAGLLLMTRRAGLFSSSGITAPAESDLLKREDTPPASSKIISITETPGNNSRAVSASVPLLAACGMIILISALKNLGFGFPSEDIAGGLIPEISRIPYAAGLAAAGIAADKNRRNGMMCTVAALIIPFIMLGLTSEPLSSAFFWGLDYLFFGFFTVFRVVLFLDISARMRRPELAPLGLLTGRIGDAAGTAVCLLLSDSRTVLILISMLLFFPAVFLLFNLYRKLYEPGEARQKTEQEVFEAFCLHNDFSARERDIFRMIIAKQTNGEIAEALFISENTVKYHVRNLLQKTGCKNRTELQRKYMLSLYPGLGTSETGS